MKDNVLEKIKDIASKYGVEKVILFGSRARGDHLEVSDYDIAIFDEVLSPTQKALINNEVEEIETLKKVDVIFVDKKLNDKLVENIYKEGIVIYEKTRG